MGHFLRPIRVASGIWNDAIGGVWTLLEQSSSEMHFQFSCYRDPRLDTSISVTAGAAGGVAVAKNLLRDSR